jgi:hypothetical protein
LQNELFYLRRFIRDTRADNRFFRSDVRTTPDYWFSRYIRESYRGKRPVTEDKYIGIEIECLIPDSWKFEKDFLPYRKYLSIDKDGSIQDEESYSGKEFKILARESEIADIVRGVTDILNAHGARVNETCGLHVHFDMRTETSLQRETIYSKLYHSLTLLKTIVPKTRRMNIYCKLNKTWSLSYFGNRYKAINVTAYHKHHTTGNYKRKINIAVSSII